MKSLQDSIIRITEALFQESILAKMIVFFLLLHFNSKYNICLRNMLLITFFRQALLSSNLKKKFQRFRTVAPRWK